jgi:hypothetical protein
MDRLSSNKYEARPSSYASLAPGDLIQFSYNGTLRHGFVIGSNYRPTGLFLSSRGKSLNYVMLVNSLSDEAFKFLLDNIYEDEIKARYDYLKNIGFAGTYSNFRSVQLLGVKSIVKIFVNKG